MTKFNLYSKFESDVCDLLGRELAASEMNCAQFWSSLANIRWFHESAKDQEVSYSFRAAGDLISRIIGKGHYMDWYCSGPAETVAQWVKEAMGKRGWSPEVYQV